MVREYRQREGCVMNRGGDLMCPAVDVRATGIRLRRIMEARRVTVKDVQRYLGLACVQSVYRRLCLDMGQHEISGRAGLFLVE